MRSCHSAGSRAALAVVLARLAACLALLGAAVAPARARECIDYARYLRWIGRAEVAGEPASCHRLVLRDGAAFALAGGRFEILDLTEPLAPVVVGDLELPNAHDLAVDGDHAYACGYLLGLCVIDIADPHSPAVAGRLDLGTMLHVEVAGDHAFHADQDSLYVVEVADPAAPQRLASLALPFVNDLCAPADGVLCAAGSDALYVIDVSTPAAPVITGSLPVGASALAPATGGTLVYCCTTSRELLVVDLGRPAGPAVIGRAPLAAGVWAADAVLAGDIVFVVGGGGLQLVDVSEPSAPEPLGVALSDWLSSVAVAPPYAFAGSSHGIEVFDARSPDGPQAAGELTLRGAMNVAAAPACGGRASGAGHDAPLVYSAAWDEQGRDRLLVIDLDDAAAPAVIGDLPLAFSPADFAVAGELLYVLENT